MTDLVAAVVGGRVLTRRRGDRLELPAAVRGEDGPGLLELAAACGVPEVRPLAPALRPTDDRAVTLHVVEPVPSALAAACADAVALDAGSLERLSAPPAVVVSLAAELDVLAGRAPRPARRPDWFRPGWHADVDAWVDRALAAGGLRRTAASRLVKVWSLAALLRVPTTAGEVVLKAVGEPFTAEPAVTAWLAALLPGRVPDVLATEPTRGWTLMRAFSGPDGGDQPGSAPAAARVLAEVQLTAAERLGDLRSTGVPDRSLDRTLAALAEVVRDGSGGRSLDAEERDRAAGLPSWLEPRFAALQATGLPTTLVHGDLHMGNYAVTPAGVLLFDWTDAALGHPALDAVLLASSAGRSDPALESMTLTAWADAWRSAWPGADVDAALAIAPAAHLAYQAVSYDSISRAQEDASRWELGGTTAHVLRRLLALHADDPCVGT